MVYKPTYNFGAPSSRDSLSTLVYGLFFKAELLRNLGNIPSIYSCQKNAKPTYLQLVIQWVRYNCGWASEILHHQLRMVETQWDKPQYQLVQGQVIRKIESKRTKIMTCIPRFDSQVWLDA